MKMFRRNLSFSAINVYEKLFRQEAMQLLGMNRSKLQNANEIYSSSPKIQMNKYFL